MLHPN